jgi:hypothetical protein
MADMRTIIVAASDGLHCDGSIAALGGEDVTSLARSGTGWLAVIGGADVHRITDGFGVIPIGKATRKVDSVADFVGAATAGTADARLEVIDGTGRRDTAFDAAPGRDTWYTPWGGPPAVRSLDEGPDGTRWVNVHVGGVLVEGHGAWRPTMDVDNDVHQVIADPGRPGAAWTAAAIGLGWTFDHGATWSWTDDGMRSSYARAVAVVGDAVFVSGSDGPGGGRAMLYRGRVGTPLEPCSGPYDGNIDTGWLAAAGDTVAFLTPDGVVMVSTDGGTTWDEAFRVKGPRALLLVP